MWTVKNENGFWKVTECKEWKDGMELTVNYGQYGTRYYCETLAKALNILVAQSAIPEDKDIMLALILKIRVEGTKDITQMQQIAERIVDDEYIAILEKEHVIRLASCSKVSTFSIVLFPEYIALIRTPSLECWTCPLSTELYNAITILNAEAPVTSSDFSYDDIAEDILD